MEHTAHGGEAVYSESGAAHITPPAVYFRTYVILLVLMALTIAASYVDLGMMVNNAIAMAIAITKASFVVMYFMQVKGSSRITVLWALIGFATLPFMFATLVDYLTRDWIPHMGWQ
jgi:cytochrome c oxidase subunit IV